jgi:hypothetical protein
VKPTHPVDRAAAVQHATGVLLSVVPDRTERYDVHISRVMPATWPDRLAGYWWRWCVDVAGYPVGSGYTWTENAAERKAALSARLHHRPPARAKHSPDRTYSINL